jgi:metal-responsive CopG/Arc/MetJ family transcriptional regulator
MKSATFKLFDFELEAIDRAAEREGISRSAFIRRACDNELIEMA